MQPDSRSERFRRASRWQEATNHPFVRELVAGTLSRERFARYVIQDYLFVRTLVDAVAYLVAKAPGMDRKRRFVQFLQVLTGAEDAFFRETFEILGIPPVAWGEAKPEPLTERFCDFLLRATGLGGYAEGLAVLLPVEWIYLDWALAAGRPYPEFTPYRRWIELHATPEFQAFVEGMRADFDALVVGPGEEDHLRRLFQRVVEFEIEFWTMAYGTA